MRCIECGREFFSVCDEPSAEEPDLCPECEDLLRDVYEERRDDDDWDDNTLREDFDG